MLALLLLALATSASGNLQPQLQDSDFVFATGTCVERLLLAKSTRAWRRTREAGPIIPAFMLVDNETSVPQLNQQGQEWQETYAFHPDDGKGINGPEPHGYKVGDTRAALAPFAAHKHFWPRTKYKWMLYGDDDTAFFIPALKKLLADYDPEQPIALTDNLWYSGKHPNMHAPRCLPCHLNDSSLPALRDIMSTPHALQQFNRWWKKPGGPSAVEFAADPSPFYGRRYRPSPACPICTPAAACGDPARLAPKSSQCKVPFAHGGAGIIFSVGLLRALDYDSIWRCFMNLTRTSGGDAMVSICLWHAGYAFTDPGETVRHLYDAHYTLFGGDVSGPALRNPMGEIVIGRCDAKCLWAIRTAVSLHLKGRSHHTWRSSAASMYAAVHAMQAAAKYLDLKAEHKAAGLSSPADDGGSAGGGGGSSEEAELTEQQAAASGDRRQGEGASKRT